MVFLEKKQCLCEYDVSVPEMFFLLIQFDLIISVWTLMALETFKNCMTVSDEISTYFFSSYSEGTLFIGIWHLFRRRLT